MNVHDIVTTLSQYIPQAIMVFTGVGLADWVIGILASLKRGEAFSIQKLPGQLESIFLPYLTPMIAAAIGAPGDWKAVVVPMAVAATLKLLDDIKAKLISLAAPAKAP